MARILPGPTIIDIRQRIGAVVHQGTPGGNLVRTQKAKRKSRSPFQQLARSNWTSVGAPWNLTLTQNQRDAWNAFAGLHPVPDVFGNLVTLSGFANFIRLNRPLAQIGAPQLQNPPADLLVTQQGPPSASTDSQIPAYKLTQYWPPILSTEQIQIFSGPCVSPGHTRTAVRYTLLKSVPYPASTPIDFTTAYLLHFVPAREGQKMPIQIRVLNTRNGATSRPTTILTTVGGIPPGVQADDQNPLVNGA